MNVLDPVGTLNKNYYLVYLIISFIILLLLCYFDKEFFGMIGGFLFTLLIAFPNLYIYHNLRYKISSHLKDNFQDDYKKRSGDAWYSSRNDLYYMPPSISKDVSLTEKLDSYYKNAIEKYSLCNKVNWLMLPMYGALILVTLL